MKREEQAAEALRLRRGEGLAIDKIAKRLGVSEEEAEELISEEVKRSDRKLYQQVLKLEAEGIEDWDVIARRLGTNRDYIEITVNHFEQEGK